MVRTLERLSRDDNACFEIDAQAMGRTASKVEDCEKILCALAKAVHSFEGLHHVYGAGSFQTRAHTSTELLEHHDLHEPPFEHHGALPPRSRPERPAPEFESASFGKVTGNLSAAAPCPAKPIQASRLSFPSEPAFDPSPFLDKSTRERYQRPLDFAAPPDLLHRPPPPVRVLASNEEKVALLRLLASSGRLRPIRPDPARLPYAAGLFCVIKDLQRDRLILDARPGNTLERPPNFWTGSLASYEAVTQIRLREDEVLAASAADLKDFFYQFVPTEQRLHRNLLCCTLSLAEAESVFGYPCADWATPAGRVHVSLATLAMGDSAACEYAQGSHLGLLSKAGVVSSAELLTLHRPPPRGLLSIGVVIDDLVILERLIRPSLAACRFQEGGSGARIDEDTVGKARLDSAYAAYNQAKLLANRAKGCCNELKASLWGIELDGLKGLVRPAPARLGPLLVVTSRVVALGLVTRPLLESLLGSWVSILLVRRRLLSLLHLTYAALRGTSGDAVIRMSPGLRDELLSLVCLGPFAVADLRARVLPRVYATDASTTHIAACEAPLHEELAGECLRHSLMKGSWTRLLSPSAAWLREHDMLDPHDELPDSLPYTPHPVWQVLATALPYRELWRERLEKRKHINLSELGASLKQERRIALSYSSCRFLAALDSQVGLGALCKGRAAAVPLNRMLKASVPTYLGGGLYPHYGFFKSEENPADAPTRGREVAPPSASLPHSWLPLINGDAGPFDRWLSVFEGDGRNEGLFHPSALDRLRSEDAAAPVQPELATRGPPKVRCRWDDKTRSRARVRRSAAAGPDYAVPPGLAVPLRAQALAVLGSFPRSQFLHRADRLDLEQPGALELFAARSGVAKALCQYGAPWVLTFTAENLHDASLRRRIELMIEAELFRSFGAAPVSSSFSVAVRPPWRSAAHPEGLPGLPNSAFDKVARGNSLSKWIRRLLSKFDQGSANKAFWIGDADSSFLWQTAPWAPEFGARSAEGLYRFDMCRYGTKWRKRSRLATNTCLKGLRQFCRCAQGTQHLRLCGRSALHDLSWTRVAQVYPRSLCDRIARAVCLKTGWSAADSSVSIEASKVTLSRLPGEALRPGPVLQAATSLPPFGYPKFRFRPVALIFLALCGHDGFELLRPRDPSTFGYPSFRFKPLTPPTWPPLPQTPYPLFDYPKFRFSRPGSKQSQRQSRWRWTPDSESGPHCIPPISGYPSFRFRPRPRNSVRKLCSAARSSRCAGARARLAAWLRVLDDLTGLPTFGYPSFRFRPRPRNSVGKLCGTARPSRRVGAGARLAARLRVIDDLTRHPFFGYPKFWFRVLTQAQFNLLLTTLVPYCRIGEAQNPGPRWQSRAERQRARTVPLEAQPLISATTSALGARCWSSFLSWCSSRLSFDFTSVFFRSPHLLAMALRAYGSWLYSSGGSIYILRHTLLAAQRKCSTLKPVSGTCWELISRWEKAEPPQHRVPTPEPVLRALVALSFLAGFEQFAGILVLAFYGLARVGEVLHCCREDLLLPGDDLWATAKHAFLRLRRSKTSGRGRPQIQHLRITDADAIALLEVIYGGKEASYPLYLKSPSAFRYRWNIFLKRLSIEPTVGLSPGGLRGGGAVEAYRQGLGISELQFRMRLKNQHTLEFYIQELAAVTALGSLGEVASRKVKMAADLYPFLSSQRKRGA